MKRKLLLFALLLLHCSISFAQMGIGTPTPEATLDIRAVNHNGAVTADDGLLVPRVNSLATAGTIDGQMVFLTADAGTFTKGFHYWNGSAWTPVGIDPTSDSWTDNGISNTNSTRDIVIGNTTGSKYAKLEIQASNQGILLPKINLTSASMDLNADGDNNVSNQPIGLLVYNSGTTLTKGYYFWNGSEWRTIDNSTAVNPSITNVNCAGVALNPSTYTLAPYNGILTIPYENGNGGTYAGGTSIISNGLTFTLQAGRLESGSGLLVFKVTGTPSAASPALTNITMDNTLIPFMTAGFNCVASVGEANVETKTTIVMGPLTNNGAFIIDNTGLTPGVTNDKVYEKIITSPDGKFSVRLGIVQGYQLQYADLTIRNNTGSPQTIMWNFSDNFSTVGYLSYANNASTIPGDGKWYGNNNGTPDSPESSTFVALPGPGATVTSVLSYYGWADQDVYNAAPEFRRYTWTTTNTSDQTIYNLEFMMGAPNPAAFANDVNCAATKVYLKIEQITAR